MHKKIHIVLLCNSCSRCNYARICRMQSLYTRLTYVCMYNSVAHKRIYSQKWSFFACFSLLLIIVIANWMLVSGILTEYCLQITLFCSLYMYCQTQYPTLYICTIKHPIGEHLFLLFHSYAWIFASCVSNIIFYPK